LRAGWPVGETTFGENVATTLLTPLAEVEADTVFSPTLMVVLTALACEYTGHVPVSPLQLLCGLGRRLMSFPRQCIRGINHFGFHYQLLSSIYPGDQPSDDDTPGSRMRKDSSRTNLRRPASQEHLRSPYIPC
jgi:hypothetical protein